MEIKKNRKVRLNRGREYWRGMNLVLKNPLTTFGLGVIILLIATALLAPYLAPLSLIHI